MKKLICMALSVLFLFTGCGSKTERTQINLFAAASLSGALDEITSNYEKENNVNIAINADSSGTLLTQIEEGYTCDIFFSAAQKQMDKLQEDGLIVDGTRKDLLNNELVVIANINSDTNVTGLNDIEKASSIALAGGSVPAGKYAREALVNLNKISKSDDVSKIETAEISKELGGVEISEQSNVSKVLMAVAEGSCEVGCVYYSDTYGYEDKIKIIEKVDKSLTGDIIYPICQVKNNEADRETLKETEKLMEYLSSDEAKEIYKKYYFDTNIN
ncbi:MAG: molybdate ABC transporter substrate-binding protein [Lachnospirales bacterium]